MFHTNITLNDLLKVRADTPVHTDDNMDGSKVPFIQANSMERIISLLETVESVYLVLPSIVDTDNKVDGYGSLHVLHSLPPK